MTLIAQNVDFLAKQELTKLKKKAEKINKMSGNSMVLIITRLKKYDNSKRNIGDS